MTLVHGRHYLSCSSSLAFVFAIPKIHWQKHMVDQVESSRVGPTCAKPTFLVAVNVSLTRGLEFIFEDKHRFAAFAYHALAQRPCLVGADKHADYQCYRDRRHNNSMLHLHNSTANLPVRLSLRRPCFHAFPLCKPLTPEMTSLLLNILLNEEMLQIQLE